MYNTGKRISVKRVVEKVYRDYSVLDDIQWSDLIEWVSEAINYLGLTPTYEEKVAKVEITDGRGELPCDIMSIRGVRDFNTHRSYVRSFDQFHLSNWFRCEDEEVENANSTTQYTYITNGNYIFPTDVDATLEISYWAMPTDEEGLPMIPDDDKYIRAMAGYVGERLVSKLWWQNKMADKKLAKAELERDWAFGSAKSRMVIPDPDRMQAFTNQMLRLIPTINHHDTHFRFASMPQEKKNHNSY